MQPLHQQREVQARRAAADANNPHCAFSIVSLPDGIKYSSPPKLFQA
jgi:hypothetical protein